MWKRSPYVGPGEDESSWHLGGSQEGIWVIYEIQLARTVAMRTMLGAKKAFQTLVQGKHKGHTETVTDTRQIKGVSLDS